MKPQQLPLKLDPAPRYARGDYLVTASNRSAFAFVDSWPQWPAHRLMIVGPIGAGKSHLAHIWADKSGADFIGAQTLTVERAVNPGQGQAFVLEDVHKTQDERALFHFLNTLAQRHAWLLLTAQDQPAHTKFKLPDLRSRLNGVPRCRLQDPDEELLGGILAKLFVDRQVAPDPVIIDYLLKRIERTGVAAAAVVGAIDRLALSKREPINLSHARKALEYLDN